MKDNERRRFGRIEVNRPVKIRLSQSGRYWTGRTCNVSSSGVLIELDYPGLLPAGQRLEIAVAAHEHQWLVRREDMQSATIVRNLSHLGQQRIAMQFDTPAQAMKVAG